jgi:cytochrome c oxidase cbb3-type subunit 3
MSRSETHDPIQGEIVHEYDGILEADNELPRWWLATFFGAVFFAVGYWLLYETWGLAAYPIVSYRDEQMALAAASGAGVTDDALTALASDHEIVERGRHVFETNCVVCHGDRAQGNIGPNLTDGSWLHGGAPTDIHRTIHDGVSARGMPTWGPVLGEPSVQAVTAYVLTLRDTNVPGRPAEGTPWSSAEHAEAERTH